MTSSQDTLTEYDILKAAISAGAVVYKVTEFLHGEHFFIASDPIRKTALKEYYIVPGEQKEWFLDACKENNIVAITLEEWSEAEREAFLSGHPDFRDIP